MLVNSFVGSVDCVLDFCFVLFFFYMNECWINTHLLLKEAKKRLIFAESIG